MTAIRDLRIPARTTFRFKLTWYQPQVNPDDPLNPVDLTGAHAQMQVRKNYNSPVIFSLDEESGEIALGEATGELIVDIPWEKTGLLQANRNAVYDILVEFPTGRRMRCVQGNIVARPAVTEWDDGDG